MFDGDGRPVPDAMVEIWQADAQGRFSDPQDKRALSECVFQGIRPHRHRRQGRLRLRHRQAGLVPDPDGKPQAPHHHARGVRTRHAAASLSRASISTTRRANARDPVLALVPAERRATLIATAAEPDGNASIASTSICRATTRRCSSTCRRGRRERGMIIGRQQDVTVAATSVMERTVRSAAARDHGVAGQAPARLRPRRQADRSRIPRGRRHYRRDGPATTDTHNEVVLMAGSLGVSALVCLLNNGDQGNTETAQSLLGPFWRLNSPRVENGGSIVRSDTPGPALFVSGHVVDRRPSGRRRRGRRLARLAGRPLREPGPRSGRDEPARQVHDRCRWSLLRSAR